MALRLKTMFWAAGILGALSLAIIIADQRRPRDVVIQVGALDARGQPFRGVKVEIAFPGQPFSELGMTGDTALAGSMIRASIPADGPELHVRLTAPCGEMILRDMPISPGIEPTIGVYFSEACPAP